MNRPILEFNRVNVVFGDDPERALPLMDQGKSRAEVEAESGQIAGVHDCSLTINEGEIVVLMGLSGSGKSSLLRCVNGLNPITRGALWVRTGQQDIELSKATKQELLHLRRQKIAMVFQSFALMPWRSVRENVALGLELSGLPRSQRDARVTAQLALVGLSAHADRQVSTLSGGMQQRVGLARAFATEAPILLMDEPFSALDPLIRSKLQDELLSLQTQLKRTILFVSHDLDEAFRIGNRIALMEGGRIVQCGTPREILTAPATPYVAEFIAHMNPLQALRARDLMEPGHRSPTQRIAAEAPFSEILALLSADHQEIAVEDAGKILGHITQKIALATLARYAQR